MKTALYVSAIAVVVMMARAHADELERNFVGTVQLDYMAIPTEKIGRDLAIDGATTELSLKLTQDFGAHVSSSVKVCVACHGLEVGMAFFDLRVADELKFRVGRFTPAFGEFPRRHDPANHRTSDKPLPYDMGRMVRMDEWNLGVLPSPWVDNGLEISGAHFFGEHTQLDYAAYAIGGPRTETDAPVDFDYVASRDGDAHYADNNSQPTVGAFVGLTQEIGEVGVAVGASAMTGTYDKRAELGFELYGGHAVVRYAGFTLRGEYLRRRTEMAPHARFKFPRNHRDQNPGIFIKEGFVLELDVPIWGRIDAVLRWDGLHRVGNVGAASLLSENAGVLRYTAGATIALYKALRLKLSGERYDFRDFEDEVVVHLGIAGPF